MDIFQIFKMQWTLLLFCSIAPSKASDMSHRAGDTNPCNKTVGIYQAVSSPPLNDTNRDRPLHCSYKIRVRPARDDWVVFVRFTRMRVGRPSDDRTQCIGGYVQIIDGYKDSNYSNRESAGFYCGDIDSPKTFISETPHVKIIFHVDRYTQDTFLQFDANVEKQGEVPTRYGQFPHLYPHRRGAPVPGSYCDRTFHECAPGRCFVQSPGFPGIYPRNLHCRYHVTVKQNLVGLDLTSFNVDGLRCDNLLLCFPRPVSKRPEDCPYDIVRVYDGPTEDSPIIVSICGRGRLKSNIIASGPDMLVEFITSNAGPLLNTGFHFKADSIIDPDSSEPLRLRNNSCFIERYLPENKESTFSNLRSWYPANTTCAHRFVTTSGDVIRLEFTLFRVERFTECKESLKLYDSSEPDPTKIITKLCDMNKPQTMYETTGNVLYVEFVSTKGSLDGSSISYEFHVKSVGATSLDGGHACNKVFDWDGRISLSLSDFNATGQPIHCNYTLDASSLPHGRVNLTLETPFEKISKNCADCKSDQLILEVQGVTADDSPICLCQLGRRRTDTMISLSSKIIMIIQSGATKNEMKNQMLPSNSKGANKDLIGRFAFFTDRRCGPETLQLDLQGSIAFPSFQEITTLRPVRCQWKIPLLPGMDVGFRLVSFQGSNCTSDYLLVNHVLLCPTLSEHSFVVQREDMRGGPHISLDLRAADASEINFTLWWTQLRVLPPPSSSSDYSLVSLGKECEFLCAASLSCIRKELVCNGVPNCPKNKEASSRKYSADEEPTLCQAGRNNLHMYWWIAGFGACVCLCLLIGVVYSICRRCKNNRERF